ncbi:DUF6171 family protein [Lederbergia citrea]|uniref:Uncharacterized protein n=1 Tax=Lederbergia citrea TaxID=2833581 RepID=A0A942UPP1_9BACI|nr:DUF6171 family protein [Lederbergia citrea]MBS4223262.1 hypothetical protein [Lederbergia citrea]
MNGLCKGCTGSVIVSDEVLEDMLLDAKQRGLNLVQDQIYEERLRICNSCPSLQYGTTCMHSGSLVRYRAKIAESNCPFPHGAKWSGGDRHAPKFVE